MENPLNGGPMSRALLRQTFLHVPTIGERREADLWRRGYTDWDRFRRGHPAGPFRDHVLGWLDESLAASRLSRAHAWRLFPSFASRVLYLDIETTGLRGGYDDVTCIGTYDGSRVRAYVQGHDLDEFGAQLERADLLVTYNGACFDIPFLKAAFPRLDLDRPRHIDLRYPLRRLGLTGGLKGIEPQMGVARHESVEGVDGYTAVLLWRAHQAGHPRALETLIRYCLEDVVNLEPLMVATFNRLAADLPLGIAPLPRPSRPRLDVRADRDLVRSLLRA
jgi:uncharacterized protein YprB with RNaseH-like and TPR domain